MTKLNADKIIEGISNITTSDVENGVDKVADAMSLIAKVMKDENFKHIANAGVTVFKQNFSNLLPVFMELYADNVGTFEAMGLKQAAHDLKEEYGEEVTKMFSKYPELEFGDDIGDTVLKNKDGVNRPQIVMAYQDLKEDYDRCIRAMQSLGDKDLPPTEFVSTMTVLMEASNEMKFKIRWMMDRYPVSCF